MKHTPEGYPVVWGGREREEMNFRNRKITIKYDGCYFKRMYNATWQQMGEGSTEGRGGNSRQTSDR